MDSSDEAAARAVWPFYLFAENRDLELELGVLDEEDDGRSFGGLGENQLRAMRDLKTRFFPDRLDEGLVPRIEPLT